MIHMFFFQFIHFVHIGEGSTPLEHEHMGAQVMTCKLWLFFLVICLECCIKCNYTFMPIEFGLSNVNSPYFV